MTAGQTCFATHSVLWFLISTPLIDLLPAEMRQ
jgi:hypothetical protein